MSLQFKIQQNKNEDLVLPNYVNKNLYAYVYKHNRYS